MFDKYFICGEKFENVVCNGEITGFQIGVRASYYRGVSLAIIKDFKVWVDGEQYTKADMTVTINGRTFTFEEMVGNTEIHWDFGDVALLHIKRPGGLSLGEHDVAVYEELRIVNGMNIAPVPFCAKWEKKLKLQVPRCNCDGHQPLHRGISLYSFQDEIYLGKMNLESCVRAVSEMGADGIEIISEAIIPNFPNPPQAWVDYWFYLMEKYHTIPVCYDMFLDGQIIEGIDISEDRAVEIMELNIRMAARLGFRFLRVVYTIPLSVIGRALPCAEKYNVVLGLEIHPPFRLGTPWVDQYVDFIKESGTNHFGLIPDFGIFIQKPIPALERKAVLHGAHQEIVNFISQCYCAHMTYEETLEQLEIYCCNEQDYRWAKEAFSYTYCDPALLEKYIPYIVHIHGKVYDMVDGEDPSVDNDTIFRILRESGWSGWVCTEYEGGRIYHDVPNWSIDNVALVREHQEMMRRYIEQGTENN